jgi:hypothetical protein
MVVVFLSMILLRQQFEFGDKEVMDMAAYE